jgi:uncharacterized protein
MKVSKYNFIIENKKYNNWLLYNSFCNSLLEVDKDIKYYLESLKKNGHEQYETIPIGINEKTTLVENGFIIEDDFDELNYVKQRDEKIYNNLWNRNNIVLTLCPTYKCNLDCTYCFVHSDKQLTNFGNMTVQVQESIVEMYHQHCLKYASNNAPIIKDQITWYGGEPLLNIDIINNVQGKINKLANEFNRKIKRIIVTNGILLNKEVQKILKDNEIKLIQVTIDGPEIIHNKRRVYTELPDESFKVITKNLAELDEYFTLIIRVNIDKENATYLSALLDELVKLKIWPYRKNTKIILGMVLDCHKKNLNIFNIREFESVALEFRKLQLLYFNDLNPDLKAKFKLELPTCQTYTRCTESFHNNGWIVGPLGDIYTCWENIGRKQQNVGSINTLLADGNLKDAGKFRIPSNYREKFGCYTCKLLPICSLSCMGEYWRTGQFNERMCSRWKFSLADNLLFNYNLQKQYPGLTVQKSNDKEIEDL